MSELVNDDKTICLILSGGLSTRMKTHKALLRFSKTRNFLQQTIEVYREAGIKKIIVVKNNNIDCSGIEMNDMISFIDNYAPENGRLYSIQLGLTKEPEADYCFIQNIDNPFITTRLIEDLYALKTKEAYISPEHNGIGGHPVLISSQIIKRILEIKDDTISLREILSGFSRYKFITEDKNCTLNINSPEDYQKHFSGNAKTLISG